jgi:histidinol-phosphatase (PHP family)
VLDYHLHLWPHGQKAVEPTVEQLAAYCEQAAKEGVAEIALTEHQFRFDQADRVLHGWWRDETDDRLKKEIQRYWTDHVSADLDVYAATCIKAKEAGLPVVMGMEVDYYPGRMDEVAALLSGYPFDVLLGSVHWLGTWMFDDLQSQVSLGEWDTRTVEDVWDEYTRALEELAETRTVDVLAHPDLCKVAGHRPKTPDEFYDRMAEAAAKHHIAAEVSSAGWRKPAREEYSPPPLLRRFHAHKVPVTTASDAHRLSEVALQSVDLKAIVLDAGYTTLQAFDARRPHQVAI